MTLYKWSQTSALDATADSTINWAEGQAPSSINDSARAMMAAVAKYRDDTSGSICNGGTGSVSGTASAYSVTSNQVFTSLSAIRLSEIAFVCPATNAAGVTLNVDGLGALPINSADNIAVPAGTLIQGGLYRVSAFTGEFILHDFYGNPYNVPVGGLIPYICPTVPNSSFVFPTAQAISRSTYSTLFALIGTTYGAGDGSTTFTLPDLRGRVVAGRDDMNTTAANRLTSTYFGANATALGAVGGAESQQLTVAQMPSHFHTAGISDPGHAHNYGPAQTNLGVDRTGAGSFQNYWGGNGLSNALGTTGSLTGIRISSGNGLDTTDTTGNNNPHPIVQPTIICNYILRVI
jgi:microcystin-dependent protein